MARDRAKQIAYQKRYNESLRRGCEIARLVSFKEIGHRLGISRDEATALYHSAIRKMRTA